ncbi:hypothetical protein DFR58_10160 [Anaerobacterium chartisolvens]|uniref:Uncharacterized protein n=1 Tax=Anaerobacterium chartisolvens TaxID=1297424 RepID=A0A369BJT6_9FIRM|nr:hypothetical protein [Anaerobacterium chartisolvens]RCX20858.1 hypothetical protein DFR58_10160 [Anaerobacterium chartisolvens]
MQKFEVGQLFWPGKTSYPEAPKFSFGASGAALELYLQKPSKKEIESVRAGKFELGFYEKQPCIFMLFKFAGMGYMDAPYSVHLSPAFEFQPLSPGLGFALTVFLVDAATGVLEVMRYVGLSTDFSARLQKAIERQREMLFDRVEYDACIAHTYSNYPTEALVQRAEAWCRIK